MWASETCPQNTYWSSQRQHYSCRNQWQLLGPMARIAPLPTTSCYINGTKLYEESLPWCHKMNGSTFTLLHLRLCHCSTISLPSYSCGTRWPVGSETMPHTGARHLSSSVNTCCSTSISASYIRDPCHDGMLICRSLTHVHIPFWPVVF